MEQPGRQEHRRASRRGKNSVNKEMLKKNRLELIESFYEEQVLDTLTSTQREVLEQIIGEVEQDETN